jgi:hypothetical protein
MLCYKTEIVKKRNERRGEKVKLSHTYICAFSYFRLKQPLILFYLTWPKKKSSMHVFVKERKEMNERDEEEKKKKSK